MWKLMIRGLAVPKLAYGAAKSVVPLADRAIGQPSAVAGWNSPRRKP
jgi:hypothetical protein